MRLTRKRNRRGDGRNQKLTNPAACIPQPLWGQIMPTLYCAWEDEPNEELKASILLHASKQLKNKNLPGPSQAQSQQTYSISFDTANGDNSNDSGNYINYNICSVNQYG